MTSTINLRGLWFCLCLALLFLSASAMLTLDHSNFTDVVSKHDFIVVQFFAPRCGQCQALAPEYEKAANVLRSNDPPIVLAKVNAVEESNKDLSNKYNIRGFPTIKMLRDGGKISQEYKGPSNADGIVVYLTRQLGSPSKEIKSVEDAKTLVDDKKVSIVGIFPKFEGEEYQNFLRLAEILHSDYQLGHTLDAKLLPLGDSSVKKPTLRLFNLYDELVVDSQNFEVEAMQKFVKESVAPLVTMFDTNESNLTYAIQYFEVSSDKVMLYLNFTDSLFVSFKSKIQELAIQHKQTGLKFFIGDLDASATALNYFGVNAEQAPLILVQTDEKFLKTHVTPDDLAPWLEKYLAGEVKPFIRSQPIPEINDKPVKVVVTKSLKKMFFDSKKNVLLEIYAPWCGHCQKLVPTMDEVGMHFEKDPNVIIAKLDATQNDVPLKTLNVQGYPTLYFKSANGKITLYEGDNSKEDVISFIEKNRDDGSPPLAPSSNDEEAPGDEL